jgi:tetratricopeptide (TPR) repeat protein
MPPATVDWQPALLVLLGGLVVGILLLLWSRRPAAEAAAPAVPRLELRDLERQIELLIQQLRELDDTAATRTPEQLARERYALELSAAHALLANDSLGQSSPTGGRQKRRHAAARTDAAVPRRAVSVRRRAVAWTAGIGVSGAVVWAVAAGTATPRQPAGDVPAAQATDPPPASSTGSDLERAHALEQARDRESALREELARDPEDDDVRLELSRYLLARGELKAVWGETQQVLARSPGHPRALAQQAMVRLYTGRPDVAEKLLDQALAASPELREAHVYRIILRLRTGRTKEAEAAIQRAAAIFPPGDPMLARLAAETRNAALAAAGRGR